MILGAIFSNKMQAAEKRYNVVSVYDSHGISAVHYESVEKPRQSVYGM